MSQTKVPKALRIIITIFFILSILSSIAVIIIFFSEGRPIGSIAAVTAISGGMIISCAVFSSASKHDEKANGIWASFIINLICIGGAIAISLYIDPYFNDFISSFILILGCGFPFYFQWIALVYAKRKSVGEYEENIGIKRLIFFLFGFALSAAIIGNVFLLMGMNDSGEIILPLSGIACLFLSLFFFAVGTTSQRRDGLLVGTLVFIPATIVWFCLSYITMDWDFYYGEHYDYSHDVWYSRVVYGNEYALLSYILLVVSAVLSFCILALTIAYVVGTRNKKTEYPNLKRKMEFDED